MNNMAPADRSKTQIELAYDASGGFQAEIQFNSPEYRRRDCLNVY